jgi:hypothetical protein
LNRSRYTTFSTEEFDLLRGGIDKFISVARDACRTANAIDNTSGRDLPVMFLIEIAQRGRSIRTATCRIESHRWLHGISVRMYIRS